MSSRSYPQAIHRELLPRRVFRRMSGRGHPESEFRREILLLSSVGLAMWEEPLYDLRAPLRRDGKIRAGEGKALWTGCGCRGVPPANRRGAANPCGVAVLLSEQPSGW